MAIFLREAEVEKLVTMEMALDAVDACFRLQGEQKADNAPRRRSRLGNGLLHVMSGSLPSLGLAGLKTYTSVDGVTRFLVHLYGADGQLLAIMEADKLGQMRTGAASGLATRHMARENSTRVCIFGTGWQARSQVEAVCAVRTVETVLAFSPNAEHRRQFSEEMTGKLGVGVYPAATAEEALAGADIVITATNSKTPVFQSEWLPKGVHINAVGANFLARQEIDVETVRRCACVVVDSLEQARLEAGDLARAAEADAFYWDDAQELGSVVTGEFPGREDDSEITLFKSAGVAIEDVALAGKIYEAAKAKGIGQPLPF